VTGGAGFVGSTLAERLLVDGWRVTVIDAFEPFYDRRVKEGNLSAALQSDRFELIEADTRDRDALRSAFDRARPDVVVDLAARAGVRPSIADPGLYVDLNVRGLQNTLDAVASAGARLVFASSSSIYGSDPRRPFREDQVDLRPESPYGATKIAGEALVGAHHAVTGLPVAIARLFTVYGPRQRPDLAIHRFARSILAGRPVELFDEGRAERDYTYVDDVVEALVRLVHDGSDALTVNIGSHRPIATGRVVDILEGVLGRPAERILLPAQPGDVPATYADITRARERLGWEPRWRFEDGIAAFCEWLRRQEPPSIARDAAPS
jgi:UDP-glucuronate 4-epimerase